ncbi:hypothetical protein B0J11DRAFT_186247 [Dendryphion nanum]|uniref:Secreted protein n=1 Tax=Dendryphion nanum TaxID=256645 RepID=A0A9P9IAJ7_9PLEO|nr:hypothetical protein B0J11DRAFT_186247 [Dendryphion nanum]
MSSPPPPPPSPSWCLSVFLGVFWIVADPSAASSASWLMWKRTRCLPESFSNPSVHTCCTLRLLSFSLATSILGRFQQPIPRGKSAVNLLYLSVESFLLLTASSAQKGPRNASGGRPWECCVLDRIIALGEGEELRIVALVPNQASVAFVLLRFPFQKVFVVLLPALQALQALQAPVVAMYALHNQCIVWWHRMRYVYIFPSKSTQ